MVEKSWNKAAEAVMIVGASEEATGVEPSSSRDTVVAELWETIQALEEDRDVMAERLDQLMHALINAQEDGQVSGARVATARC